MRVLIFGATGMIGQAVLKQCLQDDRVSDVLAILRRPTGVHHPKLRELVQEDLADVTFISDEMEGYDACFWCLGVSSVGMSEADYRRVTYGYTMVAAKILAALSPRIAFCFVSGQGTDAKSRTMWARVKGETENGLLALFHHAYMFRPGYIQPLDDIKSRTGLYRTMYAVAKPLYPMLRGIAPSSVTDTRTLARALIQVAADQPPSGIITGGDINRIGGA